MPKKKSKTKYPKSFKRLTAALMASVSPLVFAAKVAAEARFESGLKKPEEEAHA